MAERRGGSAISLVPIAGAAVLAVGLRAPFWHAPLTADEGGYAEVARLWSRGARLYDDIWVDRPQGLIAVFRAAQAIGLGSTDGLRIAAALVAVVALVALVAVADALCGRRVAIVAGLLLATAGASPFIESFTLSGELLASVPALLSLFAFTRYLRGGRAGWLVAAGLLTGCAVLIKQSAFDAGLAALLFLALTERRAAVRSGALLVGSALVPVAIAAFSAVDRGAWWFAVVGYRGKGDSIFTGSFAGRLGDLATSLPLAAAALGVPAALAIVGWREAPLLVRLWLGAAALGVAGGGNFHAHYYIQLAAPLCVLGGIGFEPLRRSRSSAGFRAAALAMILVPLLAAPLWGTSPSRQAQVVFPYDPHLRTDRAVAAYLRAHTQPSDQALVLNAAADIYYLADRAPAVRYMWLRPLQSIDGALGETRRALEVGRPALVAVVQPLQSLDPSGQMERVLHARYRFVSRVEDVPIYRRTN